MDNAGLTLFALGLSVLNLTLLFYQGSFLILNGRRRSRSAVFAGFSLVLAGSFFILHALLLDALPRADVPELIGWGRALFTVLAPIPLAWYVNIYLSHRDYEGSGSRIVPSLAAPPIFAGLARILLFVLLAWVSALYYFEFFGAPEHAMAAALLRGTLSPNLYGFTAYVCVSVLGALYILFVARRAAEKLRRARRYLVRTCLFLVVVAFTVLAAPFYLSGEQGDPSVMIPLSPVLLKRAFLADLFVQLLISASIIFAGQASVLYEVFSGALPRLGLQKYFYKNLKALAPLGVAGALLYAWESKSLPAILFFSAFSALILGYAEYRLIQDREHILSRMRPFVRRRDLFEGLFGDENQDPQEDFAVFCRDVLQIQQGMLLPLGGFRLLVGDPPVYPADVGLRAPEASVYSQAFGNAEYTRLESPENKGFSIAVPLYNSQGRVGLFLAGEKNRGLITTEEIEIARSYCERLLDGLAVYRFARILVSLQKEYLKDKKMEDTGARRVLHDEILPELHALILELSTSEDQSAVKSLSGIHAQISELLRKMPAYDNTLHKFGIVKGLEVLCDKVSQDLVMEYSCEAVEPALEPGRAEVLFFATREILKNAERYAAAGSRLKVHVFEKDGLNIVVTQLGKSKGESSQGAGQGLSIHSAMMSITGGRLELKTKGETRIVSLFMPLD